MNAARPVQHLDGLSQDRATVLQQRMLSGGDIVESRNVVLVLMKADEMEIAVQWLREAYPEDPTLKIEDFGVYYRIDRREELTFDLEQIQELIGRDYSVYDFLVNVSTTIGRAYIAGNVFTITTDLIGLEREMPL
jgi:methane monooxygenase regulatory protein B